MRGAGSGGIGFVVTSGALLVVAVVVLAFLALGGWMLLRR
jgi:hypothetical protein